MQTVLILTAVTLRSKDQTKFLGFQIGARLASSSISSSSSSSSSSFGEDTDVILGEWIAHDDQTTRLQYWYPEKHGTHVSYHSESRDIMYATVPKKSKSPFTAFNVTQLLAKA